MEKQALVIGLGQFGMTVGRSLAERGAEVIVVDRSEALVQAASRHVAQAICLDATVEEALARLAPERRDLCVCAIGNESREGAIIVTAMLRQLGAPYILARSSDDLMTRILTLVGAHEVVNPEHAFGERLATRLLYENILDEVPLGPDLVISNFRPPAAMVGHTLIELELPRRFGLTVVAVKSASAAGGVSQPDPRRPIEQEDILVVVSPPGKLQQLAERW